MLELGFMSCFRISCLVLFGTLFTRRLSFTVIGLDSLVRGGT